MGILIEPTPDDTSLAVNPFAVGVDDPVSPTANDQIRVGMIKKSTIFACYLENNDTDSAAAQDNVGDSYGLRVSTTAGAIGYTTADENNSNTAVKIQDIASNKEPALYTTSDDPGVVLVTFLAANIDAIKA